MELFPNMETSLGDLSEIFFPAKVLGFRGSKIWEGGHFFRCHHKIPHRDARAPRDNMDHGLLKNRSSAPNKKCF